MPDGVGAEREKGRRAMRRKEKKTAELTMTERAINFMRNPYCVSFLCFNEAHTRVNTLMERLLTSGTLGNFKLVSYIKKGERKKNCDHFRCVRQVLTNLRNFYF